MRRYVLRFKDLQLSSRIGVVLLVAGLAGCHKDHQSHRNSGDGPVNPVPAVNDPKPVPAATPNPPQMPPSVEVESIRLETLPFRPVGLTATVRNNGPVTGEIGGQCNFKCPVVIHMESGFLQTTQGTLVPAGTEKVLEPGGGVTHLCDGNKQPLQMSCTFNVRAYPSNGGPTKTIQYSQVVTPP
jgi:hypothetical protein